jgi:hypothetical protein
MVEIGYLQGDLFRDRPLLNEKIQSSETIGAVTCGVVAVDVVFPMLGRDQNVPDKKGFSCWVVYVACLRDICTSAKYKYKCKLYTYFACADGYAKYAVVYPCVLNVSSCCFRQPADRSRVEWACE